jgi:hypothetical protein
MANGKLPKPTQLAYLITRSIADKGISAGDELQDTMDEVNERYKDKLIIALHKDMETLMKVTLGGITGSRPTYQSNY